ncbi:MULTISPECIES: undecaprenyl-phosphate glucose phosphotransferase [Paenibacillus]|uniref:undecaprenyl-phosphate glucose phosphotransferase n=1 Tax=Paenibacillus TaxID=44249 RepID=UPI0022B89A59|nr:undecaprenyl-phosphate glucose phosphotransferase [Paenibacillus caseinilyticus]MCZ8523115.1 undecaprenyl-phosphate glucose phosphotransferase [Paenibacillus caseinilyticus]
MLRGKDKFLSQVYALTDFIAVNLVFFLAWWIKFISGIFVIEIPLPLETYYLWTLIYAIISVPLGYFYRLYSSDRKRKEGFGYEVYKVLQVNLSSLLILLSLLFIFREIDISRYFLAVFVTANVGFVILYRYFVKITLKMVRRKGYNRRYVLILGAGSLGKKFLENMALHREIGYEVVGFLDDFHASLPNSKKPILGKIDDLENIFNQTIIDEVVIALPLEAHHKIGSIIERCEKFGTKALIIPDYYDYLPARPYFENFVGLPIINVRDIPLDDIANRMVKRAFDIAFSLTAILALLPLMILIGVGVKVTSPGPIIFRQERVGLNRRTFEMYKFRSMRSLPPGTVDTGWTVENDPRKTKFGSFLRKTSLDELPQFFNVLFGHMSVVGPRPERPYYVEQFKEEIPKYMVKHHIRPGITGWAQSNGLRGDTSIEDRINHDIFYIENWSFLFDIKIIWKTIVNGFVNKNAY